MQSAKRYLEAYLGIPPADPGQGTAWRVESRPVGPEGWPEWLIIALAGLLVAAVVYCYFREAHRLPRSRRLLLAGLRLTALGLVATMLSQATLAVDRTGLPVVAVLIDDSASMGLPEGKARRNSRTPPTRLDLVRETLRRDDARFLQSLTRRFRVRVYRFADAATVLSPSSDETGRSALLDRVNGLTPDGKATRPAAAVRQVLDDLRGASPGAIVVFTDGVSTTGEADALSAVATFAARRRVPLYPVGVGSDGPARDLELYDVIADEVAFLGDPVRIAARFRVFGLRGKPVRIVVTDRATRSVLTETTVEAGPDGRSSSAELSFTPKIEGELDVTVTLRADRPEANRQNNAATRHVSVRKQSVRVLLADHAPRYEFRFLKSLLEREPTIDVDTVLQEADLGFSEEDRTALERFPLRKEDILAYDVIIFGDLDPGLLGAEVLSALDEFVRVKGGGLIGIAGTEYFPARYAGTPLEPLLPVEPARVTVPSEEAVLTEPFRLQVTIEGRQSGPMFRLADRDEENRAIWNSLPGLYWRADAPALRPGGVTLAETSDANGRIRPVIALQRFGAGKVLLHLTDETWRWRFRTGDQHFGRYWIQAIRYLSRAALLSRDRGAELTSDRRSYSQGEPVTLRVRFHDEQLTPSAAGEVTVLVEDRSGGRQTVDLPRVAPASNLFEGRLNNLPEGSYHAWVQQPAFDGAPPATDFRIDAPQRELARRGADLADLRRAAEMSGGRYFDLEDAGRLPSRLPAGRPVRLEAALPKPLWNRPELLLALAGVLTLEWLVRKRCRLA
ncbi:MAG: VWA domain-containing protein [Planctomycetaceae bacterium]